MYKYSIQSNLNKTWTEDNEEWQTMSLNVNFGIRLIFYSFLCKWLYFHYLQTLTFDIFKYELVVSYSNLKQIMLISYFLISIRSKE